MKPLSNANPLSLGLAAILFTIGSPVVMAQDTADEDDSDAIETIVVTGSRLEQNIEDVAGSISVMTNVDIEEQMVTDMSQLFRYEPGIDITGSNGTAQNIVVRGMGADRVMMIKDGMRMNEGYGADGLNDIVGRGFIDPECLKQVEVAKGATSSLYGADALGGIVAFATLDASDVLRGGDFAGSVSVGGDGRSDEGTLGLRTAFRVGNFETFVCAKSREGNETKNFTDERQHAEIQSNSLLLKGDYVIDADQKITLSFDHYDQDVDRPDDGSDKGTYLGLSGWTINSEFSLDEKTTNAYRLRYRNFDLPWAFADQLDVAVYLNESDQKDTSFLNYDTPLYGEGVSRDDIRDNLFEQNTWGVSLSAGNNTGRHYLSYGFDWDLSETQRPILRTRIQTDGTEFPEDGWTAPFPKNETERLGAYLQDTIEIGERVSVIPGLRYDYYKLTPLSDPAYDAWLGDAENTAKKISDSNLSARLGMVFGLTDNANLFVQAAQGFKVPPYDLAYFYYDRVDFNPVTFSFDGIRVLPADNLVPEESESYEIGLRGNAGPVDYTVSAYFNDYKNFIQIAYLETVDEVNTDFGIPIPAVVDVFQYQNVESVEISGIEAHLGVNLNDNLYLFLNGEVMDGKDKDTGDKLRTLQPLKGTLGLRMTRSVVAFDAMLKWAAEMDKHPEGALTTDGYMTLDLRAHANLNDKLSFSVGVFNALGKEYIKYSRIAGVPDDGRDLTLYTEPGRTISARIRYDF